MADTIFIYLIVALNTCCQIMLIWRQKLPVGDKKKYIGLAVGIPVLIMVSMRLLIANGTIQGHVAEQSPVELFITRSASILLIAGPWFATIAAVIKNRRNRILLKSQTVS